MPTIEDRIIRYFQRDNRLHLASEIISSLEINPNSGYSTLSRMVNKGLLIRESKGYYRATSTIGVDEGVEPFRVQNFRMVATHFCGGERIVAPPDLVYRKHVGFKVVLELDGLGGGEGDVVRLQFQIGSRHGQLTFTFKAPLGLDLYGFQFALAWLDERCREYGFVDPIDWRVDRGTELLKDMPNIDMDSLGSSCVTRYDYEGYMEKVYQKKFGVRRELKVDKPTSLESIEAILMGGLPTGMMLNATYESLRNQEKAVNIMKSQSVGTYEMQKMFEAMTQAFYRVVDRMDVLEKKLDGRD